MAQIPRSLNWGHLGVRSVAEFAEMNPATFAQQQVSVDQGNGTTRSYLSNGGVWAPVDGVYATYSAAEIDNRAGTGFNVALQSWLATHNLPRGFVMGQVGGLEVTACNTGCTWTASNNGGFTRLNLTAGTMGLTAASNGRYLRISSATGLPDDLYRMTWFDSTHIDLADTVWPAGGLSTPVVAPVNTPFTVMAVALPANVMGAQGLLEYDLSWRASSSASAKFGRVTFGGAAAVTDLSFNAIQSAEQRVRIANQALNGLLASAQRCSCMAINGVPTAIQNSTALAIDTTAAVTSLVQVQLVTADDWIRLDHGKATLFSTAS